MSVLTNDEIKPINTETVHRICSGQVVLSLAIAVKELLENAIDAGAKNIEVRIKNYGLDAIEVIDNGSGVLENNFAALTLKHYTSKIREFNDLETVATLGFRGEALSSLCALADLTIITRHESCAHGTKLQYDHNGHIKLQSIAARSVGTTVQLSNLFSTLPVRRKEFTKNHKREFNKMCSLLHAYCLVCKDIKFTCSNQVSSNKNIILSTQGNCSVTDNIVNIFGAKQAQYLFEVPLVQPDEEIAADYSIKKVPEISPFKFELLMSSVTHGCGRSSTDRQFFYVNSRPCEPSKVAKVINETYKMYNSNQYPFVYFNIHVISSLVDVNVTPDKRQVFLEQEKLLLATVKMSLIQAFKNFPSTYKYNNLNISSQAEESPKRKLDESCSQGSFKTFLDNFKKRPKIEETCKTNSTRSIQIEEKIKVVNIKCPMTPKKVLTQKPLVDFNIKRNENPIDNCENQTTEIKESVETNQQKENSDDDDIPLTELANSMLEFMKSDNSIKADSPNTVEIEIKRNPKPVCYDTPTLISEDNVLHKSLNFTMDGIRDAIAASQAQKAKENNMLVKFRCEITPKSNKDAEQELQKEFSKDMFSQMQIIGQFNHAFIIASLNQDVFIIDQHATDEKYNFEILQQNTTMESQVLVHPKPLQLTSVDEAILLENMEVFNKNGFYFQHNPDAPTTERIKLIKIPMSKSTIFGKDDIDEMIYMLKEGADSNCRPSRIRGMFAMRACRKSVMVGKALNTTAMKRIVDHMGEIEQPWNCPHGRPTMRHLINMNLIQS